MSRVTWFCSAIGCASLLVPLLLFLDETSFTRWIHMPPPYSDSLKFSSPIFTTNSTSPKPSVSPSKIDFPSNMSQVKNVSAIQQSLDSRQYNDSPVAWCVISDTSFKNRKVLSTRDASQVIRALLPCIDFFDKNMGKKSGIWLVGHIEMPRFYALDFIDFIEWEVHASDALPTNASYFVARDTIVKGTKKGFSNQFIFKTIDQNREPHLPIATSLQIGIVADLHFSEHLKIEIESSLPNTVVTTSNTVPERDFKERAVWMSSLHVIIVIDGNNNFFLSLLPFFQNTTSVLFLNEANNTLGEKLIEGQGGYSQSLPNGNNIVTQLHTILTAIHLDENENILHNRTEIKEQQRILWCAISYDSMWPKVKAWGWEKSIAHASEALLPCLELFLTRNQTEYPRCGYWFLDGLKQENAIKWAKKLMSLTSCLYAEAGSVDHYYPRHYYEHLFEEEYWFEGRGANLLRELVVPESSDLDQTHLHIGIVRRSHNRKIADVEYLESSLKNLSLGVPTIVSHLLCDGLNIREQAEWFKSQHIIIAVHGAALSNSIFIEPNTTILQIYPYRYYLKGYFESLISKMGGYNLEWYQGDVTKAPNPRGQKDATTRKRQEWVNVSVPDILQEIQDSAKSYVINEQLQEERIRIKQ